MLALPPDYPKLNPIRPLYYFVPLIEEVVGTPLPDGHVKHMKSKLQKLAPGKRGSSPQAGGQTGA
jgi:hypothetical protein